MKQRVLAVSFAQVIRSATILLLPLSFIALIAWAMAGSATGNTSDPIRAAVWMWLAAHHLPFSLTLAPGGVPGHLSFLPVGAIALPIVAVRYGFKRTLARLDGDYHQITTVRTIFSLMYAVIATGLASVSASSGVHPQWYFAPLFGFLISFFATFTCDPRIRISAPIIFGTRIIAALLGVSSIIFGALIFSNLDQVQLFTRILQPGFLGAILLFLLNLLYLPNAIVATLSYFVGSGFAVGAGTLISPLTHRIGEVPPLPLLGTIPESSSRYFLLAAIGVVTAGAVLTILTSQLAPRVLAQSFFIASSTIFLLSYLSSGALLTPAMGAVGVSMWKFGLLFTAELALGALLALAIARVPRRQGRR